MKRRPCLLVVRLARVRNSCPGDNIDWTGSKYGDIYISITKIEYSRKPLQKAISTALTALSLGKVENVKNRMGYSDIFHDGVVVHLQSGDTFRLEKNAVIELNDFMREPGETLYNVPFASKLLTINILLANGKGYNQSFYEYDHTKNNCQSFANDIIVKNGLSNPELEEKIKKQDAGQISGTLPNEINNVLNIAVDGGLDAPFHMCGCSTGHTHAVRVRRAVAT